MINLHVLNENMRDYDGLYRIQANTVHCFPEVVPLDGTISLAFIHTLYGAQDHSLRVWLSAEPYSQSLWPYNMPYFAMDKEHNVLHIHSGELRYDGKYFFPGGETLFVNIQNMQNSYNQYRYTTSVVDCED